MTDRPFQDLSALLNEPESSGRDEAVRRIELAEALQAALAQVAEPSRQPGQDSVTLAAHLDGGLSETDRLTVFTVAAVSPEALADLEAAAALLEAVAAQPRSASADQIARARAIISAAQPAKRSRWAAGFKAVSPLQLGLSFAALAAVAMVAIFYPQVTQEHDASPTGVPNSVGSSAFLPSGQGAPPLSSAPSRVGSSWSGSTAPAPGRSQGWTAVALSSSRRTYGAASNWPTEAEAKLAALATCVKQGGRECGVAATADGKCISAAALGDASPTTAQADDRAAAERQALEACGGGACFVVVISCSGNSQP